MTESAQTTLGEQVQRYRKLAGLSGEELAELAGEGLTRSVIANLENGRKSDVTVRQLMALSAALGVPPVLLIVDIYHPGNPSPYPLPEGVVKRFNYESGETSEVPAAMRNVDLLRWITADSFRSMAAAGKSATAAAAQAFWALRNYESAVVNFSAVAREYRSITELSDAAVFEYHVQQSAEAVLRSHETLKTVGVELSSDPEQFVRSTLRDLGLIYLPPSMDYDELQAFVDSSEARRSE